MSKIATVGTFDGIHRGHCEILYTLRKAGLERGLTPVAITFSNHPLSVIAPQRAPKSLISCNEKQNMISREGVTPVILDFTPRMAAMTAREWLCNLRDNHDVTAVVIGYDNTFGCDGRSLSIDDYHRLAEELGLEFHTAPELPGISSSNVRHAVAEGNMEEACNLLGYPFFLTGKVVKGDQIGRTIGVPTANLLPDSPEHQLLPPFGTYASTAVTADGNRYPAVTNIGLRPTLDKTSKEVFPRIETHIIGFDGNLYGERLRVELMKYLRPESKFPSLEALKEQITNDIKDSLTLYKQSSTQ